MATRYLNIIGAQLPAGQTADATAWLAENPIENDTYLDLEAQELIIIDSGGSPEYVPLGAPGTYTKQYSNVTGAFADADLIGLVKVLGIWVNGSAFFFSEDSSPVAGVTVDINTTTGTIDPGHPWAGDNIILMYQSFTPPATPSV